MGVEGPIEKEKGLMDMNNSVEIVGGGGGMGAVEEGIRGINDGKNAIKINY